MKRAVIMVLGLAGGIVFLLAVVGDDLGWGALGLEVMGLGAWVERWK